MKKIIVAGLLGTLLLGTITTSAEAGDHSRGGGGRYNGHYDGRHNGGGWAGPAIIGGSGLALGALGLYTYGPLFYDAPPPYFPPEAYYPPEAPPGYYYASDGLLYPTD